MPFTVGTRRALLGGSQRILASDDFTDDDTTLLAAHTATGGGTWTKHTTSGAGDITITGNRAHNTNDATLHVSYHSLVPPTPDYDVTGTFVLKSDNNASELGIIGRVATADATFYLLRYLTSSNVWQLFKIVAGAATQLGSNVSQTLTVDQPYVAALSMRGSSIRALIDGVEIIAVTDAAITATGQTGLRIGGAATGTTGLNLDSFRVVG